MPWLDMYRSPDKERHTMWWSARDLGSAFNSSNYRKVVLSSGTTTDGSLTAPSGIIDEVFPPPSRVYNYTDHEELDVSPEVTYSRYCYAQAVSGRYYYVGFASITTPIYYHENNIDENWGSPTRKMYPTPKDDSSWTRAYDSKFSGSYCYQSREITSNQKASWHIRTRYSRPAELSFKYLVSSEYNYDFFKVYVNGYEVLRDSGDNRSFKTFTHALNAGDNLIKFEYSKDSSADNNEDKAFVDDLKVTQQEAPPSSLSGLQGNATSKSSISLSWNYSSGATSYNIYRNNVYIANTTSTSYSVNGLSEYTYYTLAVLPMKTGYGEGNGQSVYVHTLDETKPTIVITSATATNGITLIWSSNDSHSGLNHFQVYISSANGTDHSYKATVSASARIYTSTTDGNGLPLQVGSTYRIGIRAYDNAGNYSGIVYVDRTIISSKPDNWKWTSRADSYGNKLSGDFSMLGKEWNDFCKRINDFRKYKNSSLGDYPFTTAISGYDFTHTQYNEVKNAIDALNPSITIPSYKAKDDAVRLDDINRLKDSLNSIS